MEPAEAPEQVQEQEQEQEQEYVVVKKKPRARPVPKAKPPPLEVPARSAEPRVPAEFWQDMLSTKREMEKAETRARYSNLVTFK